MKEKYSLFIDETSHLEHDGHHNMCIGAIKVPQDEYEKLREDFKKLKLKYHSPFELKWSKFSYSRIPYYKALANFFFDSSLSFRCVLAGPKRRLDHKQFNDGSHDNFYYKIIYYLIHRDVKGKDCRIYLDIKDTRSREKLIKIKQIFQSEMHEDEPFRLIQHLRSEDNVFIQLADFFIGAVSYNNRVLNEEGLKYHKGKKEFIEYLEKKSGYRLNVGTPPWEEKFNIFSWQPRKSQDR